MCISRGRIRKMAGSTGAKMAVCLHSISSEGRKLLMRRVWTCLALATLTAFAGCGGSIKHDVHIAKRDMPVAKDASREELIEKFNAQASAAKSLNATVELQPTAGSNTAA